MAEEIPQGSALADISARYNHHTVPREMARLSVLPRERWGRVVVEEGGLELAFAPPASPRRLDSEQEGIIRPGVPFKITPTTQPLRFYIEYYDEPRMHDAAALAGSLGR